ncbi:MAG: SDR family NAD(P)-dependent oxidoreductase [bacterium]|nr:SDR family NAD(P)-dependent oxidoreductase [bacterium]
MRGKEEKLCTGSVRSTDNLAAAAAEVESLGVKALPVGCEVTDPAQVAATVGQAWETFGRVDILVNNADVIAEAGVTSERPTNSSRRPSQRM